MGLNPRQFLRAGQGAVGGPFEEVQQAGNADPRFRELFTTWRQLDQLEQGVAAIPSAHPIHDSIAFTSGYGVRSDPFRGRAAMHAGIDLAGPLGTPIYATADGIVGRAEYNNGGYGNLVEINHGQGIQTRYGHLSRFATRPGQRVRRGELIGYMGSTGRSTGSHLHYEVRIDGRAVNPDPLHAAGQCAGRSAAPQRHRHPGRDRRPDRRPRHRPPLSRFRSSRERPQRPRASLETAGPFPFWRPGFQNSIPTRLNLVTPAQAGVHAESEWTPAFAGVTGLL